MPAIFVVLKVYKKSTISLSGTRLWQIRLVVWKYGSNEAGFSLANWAWMAMTAAQRLCAQSLQRWLRGNLYGNTPDT